MHERLCSVFGSAALPQFPPRCPSSPSGVVSAIFGTPIGTRPEVIAHRERAFQIYFDGLCGQSEAVRTACFQETMAVVPPEPVAHLRVRGWLPTPPGGLGATALLDIRPEDPLPEHSGVVEAYHIVARFVFKGVDEGSEELCPAADFRVPGMGTATSARVQDLRPAAQVELEVTAVNAVGRSSPVSIRLLVPADARESGSQAGTISVEQGNAELERRRQELERWWSERQAEAERADAQRERQMAEFRAQREELEQEREALARERASSPLSSTHASPLTSPRSTLFMEGDMINLDDLRLDGTGAPASALLAQQWDELERVREALREEAARAAAERERWTEDAQTRQADLDCRAEFLKRQVSDHEELQRQREAQRLEAVRACEEAAQREAEVEVRQAELERRFSELREQEESREAAVAQASEEQRAVKEKLHKERAELRRHREDQQASASAAEQACQTRAQALQKEQELLDKHREEVENSRAAEEADRASLLEEIRAQQLALEEQKADLERQRSNEEELRKKRSEELHYAEKDLCSKAEQLAQKERALYQEQQKLTRSRAMLATVQAHVVSMLDKKRPGEVSLHRMDVVEGDSPNADAGTEGVSNEAGTSACPLGRSDSVYSMDWTKVQAQSNASGAAPD